MLKPRHRIYKENAPHGLLKGTAERFKIFKEYEGSKIKMIIHIEGSLIEINTLLAKFANGLAAAQAESTTEPAPSRLLSERIDMTGEEKIESPPERKDEGIPSERIDKLRDTAKLLALANPAPFRTDAVLSSNSELTPRPDWLIPKFEWDKDKEKSYKTLFFFEHEDGRVMLSYMSCKMFTTKEKVMALHYPIPHGQPPKTALSVNNRTAVRIYREYLAQDDPDDAKYKPMLKGAFSTRPGNQDYDKVEGCLEQ